MTVSEYVALAGELVDLRAAHEMLVWSGRMAEAQTVARTAVTICQLLESSQEETVWQARARIGEETCPECGGGRTVSYDGGQSVSCVDCRTGVAL